jgi:ribose transport system substrate-binding protein
MRKIYALFSVLLILGMLLTACDTQTVEAPPEEPKEAEEAEAEEAEAEEAEAEEAEEEEAAAEEEFDVASLKVYYVGVDTVSPYQMVNQAGIADKAEELGITDITYSNPPTNQDLEAQLQLMDAAILDEPDIILLVPVDSAGIGQAVQQAMDAGIAVVTIGIESVSVPPHAHVATDSINTSYEAGKAMCDAIDGDGKILIVLGNPIHAPTELRKVGFKNAIEENCPDVEIVGEQVANWTPEEAQTVVINTITAHPDLEGVYTENDTMGQGALAALEQLDRLDVMLVTYDCMQVMVEAVRDGKSYADACQMPFYEGQVALETGISIAKGEEVPEFVDAGTFVVKQENAEQFLVDFEGMLP